jgi:prefoldin subunit 5
LGKDNLEIIDKCDELKKKLATMQAELTSVNKEKHRLLDQLNALKGNSDKSGEYVAELE